jgi:hypothetical protein
VSGRNDGRWDVEPELSVPLTAAERLTALEAARDRERATIQDLEADLRKAAGGRKAAGRFRGTVVLGFSVGALLVTGLITLLAVLRQ